MDKERIVCGMGWIQFKKALAAANRAHNGKLGSDLTPEQKRRLEKLIKGKK